MKKIFLIFAAIFACTVSTFAYDFEVDGIYYNRLDGESVEVTYKSKFGSSYNEYGGYSGSITIPSSVSTNLVDTYRVTAIGYSAFEDCSNLTSVTIPNSVTTIGNSAFKDCSSLTSITIPNSVTKIGGSSFSGCSSLTAITIPNGVTTINVLTFSGCSSLNAITIPNNVTSIGSSAFSGCSSLTSITIPNSVTTIGERAFLKCSSLAEVTIGNNVTNIGNYAFQYCSSLTEITIPNSVPSIGDDTFSDCSSLTSITIPKKNCADPIKESYDPFYDIASQITSFTFGNEVEHIPAYLCSSMSNLTSITIPNSVTTIGDGAFLYCSNLTSITIPNSVITIGDGAFLYCSSITSITIPNSVTTIGNRAFCGCSSITEISIPNGITTIGEQTFYNCSSLTSITIPNSVTTIGNDVFYDCHSLTDIIWNAKNCADPIEWSYAPFDDIASQITSFTFGNEVEHIPAYLCSDMNNLTSISIPNSVTSIGDDAFYYCESLTDIIWNAKNCTDPIEWSYAPFDDIASQITSFTFGNEVEHIPAYLCSDMNNLTEITIPNNVTSIGNWAFSGCYGLTEIIWNAKNCADPIEGAYGPFCRIASQITSFTFGNEVDHIPAYLCSDMSNLTDITLPNNVTSIGRNAFSGCSGPTIITIPNSVTTIGDYAFTDCSSLTKITIPTDVTTIGVYAFGSCSSLNEITWNAKNCASASFYYHEYYYEIAHQITSFTFGDEVETIPAELCRNMNNLTSITIPNNVTSIGNQVFSGCYGLNEIIWNAKNCADPSDSYSTPFYDIASQITSFTFGNEVEHIPAYLCSSMSNLTSITIPNSVTTIGDGAFLYCSNLTSITIPNSVITIGDGAFKYCSSLTAITIPNSVTTIGSGAFYSCYDLNEITCLAVIPPTIESSTFDNVNKSIPLYVQAESVEDYKAAEYWKNFKNIQAISDSTSAVENPLWGVSEFDRKVLENGTIYILRNSEKYTIDGIRVM